MKWFDRWFARKCEQAWKESNTESSLKDDYSIGIGSGILSSNVVAEKVLEDCEHYTLKVWKAQGGRCVQYKRYDRVNDKLHTNLHVISEDQDLGDAIKHIVIQEALVGH